MDPNKTLKILRELVANILTSSEDTGNEFKVAEYFEALDHWIVNGGFLPTAWQK